MRIKTLSVFKVTCWTASGLQKFEWNMLYLWMNKCTCLVFTLFQKSKHKILQFKSAQSIKGNKQWQNLHSCQYSWQNNMKFKKIQEYLMKHWDRQCMMFARGTAMIGGYHEKLWRLVRFAGKLQWLDKIARSCRSHRDWCWIWVKCCNRSITTAWRDWQKSLMG